MKLNRSALLGLMLVVGSAAQANITITPTFDSALNSNAAAKATINSAIAWYESHITNNYSLTINFHNMGSGLGMSSWFFGTFSYTDWRSHLASHSSGDAIDTSALAHLPIQVANPNDGSASVSMTTENMNALGFNVGAFSNDISINTSICNFNHVATDPAKYDMFAVVCHEIDEVLGTASGTGFASSGFAGDMFRFSAPGTYIYSTDTTKHAFFSVDGGVTNIVEYNQFQHSPGDWGDWIVHHPEQVQDFAGQPGGLADMGPSEIGLLDAIGYNFAPVPEPASMLALGLGAVALIKRKRK